LKYEKGIYPEKMVIKMENLIVWLQSTFVELCNGDWEHGGGIRIFALDNPGWGLKVDLQDTGLIDYPFTRISQEISVNDWFDCWMENGIFEGAGGPKNLVNLLEIFKDWYTKAKENIKDT
jgi:hypothetical protein